MLSARSFNISKSNPCSLDPAKDSPDIFSMIFLYILLIYRIINVGLVSRSFFAKLYCFGFATAIFLYVFVNIAMVLGMLPIVGAPLPIMSYGGSSLLSIMLGLSIVMSCKIYNQEQISVY